MTGGRHDALNPTNPNNPIKNIKQTNNQPTKKNLNTQVTLPSQLFLIFACATCLAFGLGGAAFMMLHMSPGVDFVSGMFRVQGAGCRV